MRGTADLGKPPRAELEFVPTFARCRASLPRERTISRQQRPRGLQQRFVSVAACDVAGCRAELFLSSFVEAVEGQTVAVDQRFGIKSRNSGIN